jgi:hypothetical protein
MLPIFSPDAPALEIESSWVNPDTITFVPRAFGDLISSSLHLFLTSQLSRIYISGLQRPTLA